APGPRSRPCAPHGPRAVERAVVPTQELTVLVRQPVTVLRHNRHLRGAELGIRLVCLRCPFPLPTPFLRSGCRGGAAGRRVPTGRPAAATKATNPAAPGSRRRGTPAACSTPGPGVIAHLEDAIVVTPACPTLGTAPLLTGALAFVKENPIAARPGSDDVLDFTLAHPRGNPLVVGAGDRGRWRGEV